MENIQYENFIKLISAYINNEYNGIILNSPNWDEIYKLANLHGLGGLLYLSLTNSKLCDDAVVMDKFKQIFLILATKSMVQEATTLKLINILNKNQIRHILFKGFVLRDYYPNREVRTMGDVDIVIDETNRQKVHDILISNRFEFDEFASHKAVRNYTKNSTCFEIHTKLIENNIFDNIDLIGYFNNCFDKTDLKSDFTYELTPENHFVYLIAHMAKHFKTSGCGVRMVLDLAIFIKHFKYDIDWSYIVNELKALRLYNFTEIIIILCKKWFDNTFSLSVNRKNIEEIESYIINGGIFGYENRNIDAIRISSDNFYKKMINFIHFIFPRYEHLKNRYVWAESLPKVLLPLGWIKYWWYRSFTVKENVFKRLKLALSDNKTADEHSKLLTLVGLN